MNVWVTKYAENMWTLNQLLPVEPSEHFCFCVNLKVLASAISRVHTVLPRNCLRRSDIFVCAIEAL